MAGKPKKKSKVPKKPPSRSAERPSLVGKPLPRASISTTYSSDFPELLGRTFSTLKEQQAAEAEVTNSRRFTEGRKTLTKGFQDMAINSVTNPTSLAIKPDVAKATVEDNQLINPSNVLAGDAATIDKTPQGVASTITNPSDITASIITPETATDKSKAALANMVTPEGQVKPEALAEAITKDPSQLAQLGLSPAQITSIRQVLSPDKLKVTEGMLVNGSAVDMAAVESAAQIEAAQANPSQLATVQGQLSKLYADFDSSNPPPWAAGAMRAATAQMAQRGLAASSMAGQAIVQAAMESALPIAAADAQTQAAFETQNLSNRQQAALFGAQQRASFLKLNFDQAFQSKVVNAARIADVANINFTAEQQVALENARLAQSTDVSNLSARNAKVLSDAAAMSQLDLANLTNQQRVAVENAKTFLQMDLINLSNTQQAELFKAQATQQTILSDTAAKNAAAQFNASSENQTNQFMANLKSSTDQFNAHQRDAMQQFNINEDVAVKQFNASQKNQRDQFNSQNSLIIAQANTKWRQDVSTINTAAQNASNMEEARTANSFTAKTLDEMWQRERDLMQYAFVSSESKADRALELTLQNKKVSAKNSAENSTAMGGIFAKLLFGGISGGVLA